MVLPVSNSVHFKNMKNINRLLIFLFTIVLILTLSKAYIKSAYADTPVDFGTMTADAGSSEQTVDFYNTSGDGSVWTPTVNAPSSGAFTIDNDGCSGQPIDDGGDCQVTVDFEPQGLSGSVAAIMSISYTSADSDGNPNVAGDPVSYDLTANVTGGSGSGSGSSGGNQEQTITFPSTALGDASTQEINFVNSSTDGSDWTVTNVSDPSQNNNDFTLNDDQCSGTTISSGDKCIVDVDFQSNSDTGQQQGTMAITYTTSNGGGGTYTYDLTGTVTGGTGTKGTGGNPSNPSKGTGSTGTGSKGNTPAGGKGTTPTNGTGGNPSNPSGSGSSVSCGTDSQICNPISGVSNIQDLIVMIIKYLMGLIGILSVLMIMVGAYQLTFTGASPKSAENGKNTITYAIMGLVLSILAYSIVAVLEALIKSGS